MSLSQLLPGRGQPPGVLIADGHAGPFFQAAPGGGAADAGAGRRGDDDHLALEQAVALHRGSSPAGGVWGRRPPGLAGATRDAAPGASMASSPNSHSRTSARNSSCCGVNRTRASSWRQRSLVRRLNLPSTCLLGGFVEVTIPGAVASAAREFGDAPALADPGLAEPGAGRTWAGRTWAGRTWAGRTWAGRTGRPPAQLPRAGRAGDRGGRRAHRGGRGSGGPGGRLGA